MFSEPFSAWVIRARYAIEVSDEGPVALIADVGGEIRYYVHFGGLAGFSLTRAERSEPEGFIMSSSDLIDIERYLAVKLADDVREREGLARLQIPGRIGEYAARASAHEDDGRVTIVVGERPPVRFVHNDPYRLQPDVQFSHFAEASVAEIIESALSVSGGPLFSTN
ncbi:Imm61 family immunity protein [Cryobacterium luteum]|uniref:Uncharacterized protein n=1 Tax=Cryobacterium luteum TaxID=1424661 RepID=A0A1H8AF03_9MICO|nr:Imm61 family immunity protein [Cryobacterium luteum]TFB88478.1 hypothetical protein E3O10_11770 [Cryobacterium luteum]SEM68514.1 Immunity protein 61 [Cryobacterium luteum]